MARISTYDLDGTVSNTDKVIGTDSSNTTTKNFRIQDLKEFIYAGISGPLSINSSGVSTVTSSDIALGSSSGNYIATLTARNGITSTGATSGATINHILDVDATQSHITEIFNSSLCIGRDSTDKICFTTESQIRFSVDDALELILKSTALMPATNDGLSLGEAGTAFSDLFLASGAVIGFGNGNMSLTHSSAALTISSTDKLQFNNTNASINSSSDGKLDIDSSAEVEIDSAIVDIDASDDITIDAGDDITVVAADNLSMSTSSADGKVTISSAHTAGDAMHIDANASATESVLDIDAGVLDIDVGGATTLDSVGVAIDAKTAELDLTTSGTIDVNSGLLDIDSSGSINIDGGDNSNITITGTFDIDASAALTIDSATSISIGTNADKPIDIDSTTLDIDASDAITIDGAGFSIDSSAVSSNVTVATGGGDAKDLTISVTGGGDSSLVLTSTGTGTDALDINSSAGIDIDASGAATIDAVGVAINSGSGELDLTTTGIIDINANGTASDISISTAHTAGVAFHLDANANAGSIVDVDAGILQLESDGLTSILSGSTFDIDAVGAVTIDGSSITIGADDSGVAISIGHTTSETTVNDNLNVVGSFKINSGTSNQLLFPTSYSSSDSGKVLKVDASGNVTLSAAGDGTVTANTTDNNFTVVFASGNTLLDDNDSVSNSSFKYNPNDKVLTVDNIVPKTNDAGSLGSSSLSYSDLFLADGSIINFGNDQDVTLTHIADTGVELNSSSKLRFRDSDLFINSSSDGQLDLNANARIKINTTAGDGDVLIDTSSLDIDAAATDMSGTLDISGHLELNNSSPNIFFHTTGSHYNWMIAAQENVSAALEISVDGNAGTASDTTPTNYTPVITVNQDQSVIIGGTLTVGNGSTSIPGLNFSANTDAGFYSVGSDNIGFAANGAAVYSMNPDGITLATNKKIIFRDSDLFIHSSNDGELNLNANAEVQIETTDLNVDANTDISGTLTVGGASTINNSLSVTGQSTFSDNVEVIKSSTPTIQLTDEDSGGNYKGYVKLVGNDLSLFNSSGEMKFYTGTNRDGDSNTDIRARISSTGNVGIATDSPGSFYGKRLVVTVPDEDGITVASGNTSHKSYICFADGTTNTAQKLAGYISFDHNGDTMQIGNTGGNDRIIIASGGKTSIGLLHAGFGTTVTPEASGDDFVIDPGVASSGMSILSSTTSGTGIINFGDPDDADIGSISYSHSDNSMTFLTNTSAAVTIASDGDVTFASAIQLGSSTAVTGILDEDDMSSNSAVSLATQQSIKAYVDSTVNDSTNTVEEVQDIVGAMFSSNTETGISVDYQDSDGTIDLAITVEDESSDTECFPLFVTAATGNLAPKSGTNLLFNSSSGALTAGDFVTSSDKRLKSEIEPIKEGLEVIKQFASYTYIKGGEKESGFIAQEVREAIPHTVYENNEGYLSMSDRGVLAHMHKAILEIDKRLEAIEEKLK